MPVGPIHARPIDPPPHQTPSNTGIKTHDEHERTTVKGTPTPDPAKEKILNFTKKGDLQQLQHQMAQLRGYPKHG